MISNPISTAKIVFAIALLLFSSALLYKSFYIELGFDAAYHASVAKNIANGYGWATSYENKFSLNPDVTTGPTLILVASSVIKLIGNKIWVPAFSAILINLILFWLILFLSSKHFKDFKSYCIFSISLMAAFSLFENTWWLAFTADATIGLLAICVCLAYVESGSDQPEKTKYKYLVLAGLLLALALLAKSLAWFIVTGIILHFCIRFIKQTEKMGGAKYYLLVLIPIVLLITPWLSFKFFQIRQLPPFEQIELNQYKKQFFESQGSGISELSQSANVFVTLFENACRNTAIINEHFFSRYHLPFASCLMIIILVAGGISFRRWNYECRKNQLVTAVWMVAFLNLFWFIFISYAWRAKHALPAIYLIIFLTVYLSVHSKKSKWLAAGLLLCLVVTPTQYKKYLFDLYTFNSATSAYTRDLVRIKNHILQNEVATPIAGCGWAFAPWELEYLLPGSENFRECSRVFRDNLDADASGSHHLNWAQPFEFTLAVNKIYWSTSPYSKQFMSIFTACAQNPYVNAEYFALFHCKWNSLQDIVNPAQDLNFIVDPGLPLHVHKPNTLYE